MAGIRHNGVMPDTHLPIFDASADDHVVSTVYLTLINNPRTRRGDLTTLKLSAEKVEAALTALAGRGLIEPRPDGTFEVAPPEPALSAFAAEVDRKLRRVRASAYQLGVLHRRAREQVAEDELNLAARPLGSLADIRVATAEIVAEAEISIMTMRSCGARTEQILTAENPDHDRVHRNTSGTRVQRAAVYDARLLELDGALDILHRRQASGEDVRIADNVPFSAVTVDGRMAVLDLSNLDADGAGSLELSRGSVVEAITLVMTDFFGRGTRLPQSGGRLRSSEDRDQMILSLLVAGTSDATVARQLGISVRTVERRVSQIMERLGTSSRMQTGAEAVRRNLV